MDPADLRLRRLAVTWVNHAGAPLVKVVPWSRRQEAISTGVGFSPVSDAFRADGVIAADHRCACPDGDLRLHAVAEMVSPLIPAQGWAWAPGERRWRDGCPYDADQRWFCRRQQEQLQEVAVELSAGFELEWAVASTAAHRPAFAGGPYGADRLMECLDYATALLDALDAAELDWLQFHPEYATAQFELSLAPLPPVAAADQVVKTRLVIQRVCRSLGLRCTFSPKWTLQQAGNGGHVHFSLRRQGQPLLQGGDGPGGLPPAGAHVVAGLLEALPALMPLACPLSSSYLRLAPSSWSAPYQIWGVENREAALRLVPWASDQQAAHLELKVADPAANPYLLLGALQAQIRDALGGDRPLPEPVQGDPSRLDGSTNAYPRLPTSLAEARSAFAASSVQRAAMGELLHGSLLDSMTAEIQRAEGMTPEALLASTRWWPLVGGLTCT